MGVDQKQYVTSTQLCQRYARKSSRTLKRWQEKRNFPSPVIAYQGGSNLWDLEQVEAWEAQQATATDTALQ